VAEDTELLALVLGKRVETVNAAGLVEMAVNQARR
jgi:hypothetical protein